MYFFFSSRRRHTRWTGDWSSDVCSSDLDDLLIRFEVTDGNAEIPVSYRGIAPDLFREGQGVVAEGRMEPGGAFTADTIRSEERRVGKECRGRWSRYDENEEGVRSERVGG